MSPNAKEPKKESAESDGQHKQEIFESVALVYDGYDLHRDAPERRKKGTGNGASLRST